MISSFVTWLIVSAIAFVAAFVLTLVYVTAADVLGLGPDRLPLVAQITTTLLVIGVGLGVPLATVVMARDIDGSTRVATVLGSVSGVASAAQLTFILNFANACRFGEGWPLGGSCPIS